MTCCLADASIFPHDVLTNNSILPEDKVSCVDLSSTLAVFNDAAVPDDGAFLKLGFGIGHVLQSEHRIHSETGQEQPKWDYRDDYLEMVAWQLLQAEFLGCDHCRGCYVTAVYTWIRMLDW